MIGSHTKSVVDGNGRIPGCDRKLGIAGEGRPTAGAGQIVECHVEVGIKRIGGDHGGGRPGEIEAGGEEECKGAGREAGDAAGNGDAGEVAEFKGTVANAGDAGGDAVASATGVGKATSVA